MSDDASSSAPRDSSIQPVPPEFEDRPALDNENDRGSDTASADSDMATRQIQPVPPELAESDDAVVDAAAGEPGGSAEAPTAAIQPVPPELAGRAGVDVPTAEFTVTPQSDEPSDEPAVQPTPPGLYDVPWKPVEEPIPEWIAEPEAAATQPVQPTAAGSAAPRTEIAAAAGASRPQPVGSPGQPSGVGYSRPPAAYPGRTAGSVNRPRRAGIVAAVVVAIAVIAVGGGVIALLLAQRNGGGDETAISTIPDVVLETVAPPSSGPATTQPPLGTTAPTAAPTPAPTAAPTPAPTAPRATDPPTPNTVPGDLSLAEPMRRPACDGQFIVITANAVTPGEYQREVAEAQQRFVGAAYLKTDQTCPSLRPFDDVGNAIYSIYYGPFPTLEAACDIRDQVGGDAYVKVLDDVTPFTKIWDC